MSAANSIRLVCLDLGGVLVRICAGWEQACVQAGVPVPPKLLHDPGIWPQLQRIGNEYETGRLDNQGFADQAGRLLEVSARQVMEVVDAWLLGAYPGAVELIGQVAQQSSVPVACLSNTNIRHWQLMNQPGRCYLGLDRLAHQFTSFGIGHMKPDEAIYRHVERHMSLEPGNGDGTILFLDDNADNIAAASRCGWISHRIDSAGDPVTQVREHLIRYHVA